MPASRETVMAAIIDTKGATTPSGGLPAEKQQALKRELEGLTDDQLEARLTAARAEVTAAGQEAAKLPTRRGTQRR